MRQFANDDDIEVICNISYRRFRPIVIAEYNRILNTTKEGDTPSDELYQYALKCAIEMANKLNEYEDERSGI